jgi:Phospholipid methyltransferase
MSRDVAIRYGCSTFWHAPPDGRIGKGRYAAHPARDGGRHRRERGSRRCITETDTPFRYWWRYLPAPHHPTEAMTAMIHMAKAVAAAEAGNSGRFFWSHRRGAADNRDEARNAVAAHRAKDKLRSEKVRDGPRSQPYCPDDRLVRLHGRNHLRRSGDNRLCRQTVVTTGPYAVVRHPLYFGALFYVAATSLVLGSWWGLATVPLVAIAFAIRIRVEEKALREGLQGYGDYARRVRWRLIPFIW